MINLIAAIDTNNAIGYKGQLLCSLPADKARFKALTIGHTVVMGRRTWLSLPQRPLPQRKNIVLSAKQPYTIPADEEVFIIGGECVFRQFMPMADKLYITAIQHAFEKADTYFPTIDPTEWEQTYQEAHTADAVNPYDYTFYEYQHKTNK